MTILQLFHFFLLKHYKCLGALWVAFFYSCGVSVSLHSKDRQKMFNLVCCNLLKVTEVYRCGHVEIRGVGKSHSLLPAFL
jgi:hypothetical protein